jgi:hypothetical protein
MPGPLGKPDDRTTLPCRWIAEVGKDDLAAALWHLVDGHEVPTALVKGLHRGDYRYLEEMAQLWGEGWEVDRTKTQQVEDISINLRDPNSGTEFALEFTDLSGESFERAFAQRLCPPKLVDLVKDASGILLFVSADRMVDDVTILDAFGSDENDDAAGDDGAEKMPWDANKTPLQVQIVDLLEAFKRPPFSAKPFKIAVIISAWDLTDETSPDIWLKKRMSLLDQYVHSKDGASDVRVYGVSAQGGRLSKKGAQPGPDRERLLSMVPSKRIQIVAKNAKEHDLTAPILWLSGLEEGA